MLTDEVRLLAARADLARLLSASYYEPGEEFAEEQLFASVREAASSIDPALGAVAQRLESAYAEADRQELLIDYVRLFHGPPRALAQPYASVWLSMTTQTVMEDSTVAVMELYREAGFEIAEDFRDLPDHVSVELECLYALLFREAQAGRDGQTDKQLGAKALRRRLLKEHLAGWLAQFAESVIAQAQTPFYRTLAELTRDYIDFERSAQS
ncbi:MAG TPA: molecular chaperone TorD family protein [Burkholderiaceae bacterium]|nr:molecular chaperone TorD family protein [Burkholderiaceae bacterium]